MKSGKFKSSIKNEHNPITHTLINNNKKKPFVVLNGCQKFGKSLFLKVTPFWVKLVKTEGAYSRIFGTFFCY